LYKSGRKNDRRKWRNRDGVIFGDDSHTGMQARGSENDHKGD
jgi:hypothetical protein